MNEFQTIISAGDQHEVNPEQLRKRATELAFNHGRSADNVTEDDWTQARRELSGIQAPPTASGHRRASH